MFDNKKHNIDAPMIKHLFFLFILFSTVFYGQKNKDLYEELYMKTLTEIAARDINSALKIADSMTVYADSPQHKGRGLMLTASLYMQQGEYEQSIQFAEEAKKIFSTTESYELQAKIRGFLASEYRILGLSQQSKKYADEGIKIADKIADPQQQAKVKSLFFQELAYYETDVKKNYPFAVRYLNNSLIYLSKIPDDKINVGRTYQMLGEIYCFHLNKYATAEKYYQIALQNLPEPYFVTALVYEGMGKIRFSQQRYHEAETFFLKALDFSEKTDHPEMKRRIFTNISAYYEKTEQYKKAAVYRKKAAEITWNAADKRIKTVDDNYRKIKNENQKYESRDSARNIITGIAVISIICFIIIFIITRKKYKEEYGKLKTSIDSFKNKEKYVGEVKIDVYETDKTEKKTTQAETAYKQTDIAINKKTEMKILAQIDQFEKDEIYRHSYITLSFLATEFDTNSRYISYVVRKYKNKDFKDYINRLRVDYIIHKLNTSEKYRKYRVAALAEECGFSSHSTFATIFKSITGISPSSFIALIEEEKRDENIK